MSVARSARHAVLSDVGTAERVGRAPRRVPRRLRAALLVPRFGKHHRLPAQAAALRREGAALRDHRGPDLQGREGCARDLSRGVRREVPEGASPSSTATGPQLTAFYDYPAEHSRHLRTTNPIESAFATVRLRTRVTKGAGSKTAALAMAYKLLAIAQERWRRFNGHHLVADVTDGVKFKDGIRNERDPIWREAVVESLNLDSQHVFAEPWQCEDPSLSGWPASPCSDS